MTAVRDRKLERGERESASLPSLDVFPLFSLLMSVRMQVSFSKEEEEAGEGLREGKKQNNKKAEKDQKNKRF